jgi:hypothetical protein
MNEIDSTETVPGKERASLGDVIADLRGFGIEDFEEILILEIAGKKLQLKLSNIPTDQDLIAMLAVEGSKGYVFFQEIKVELLSRAVTWINGCDIRHLEGKDRLVRDKQGLQKDVQVVLRDTIKKSHVNGCPNRGRSPDLHLGPFLRTGQSPAGVPVL